ncbi:hypothetical protein FNH22_30555 [Fulvivirga sp. M361]|uniref:hypothetical protein n=1 Tax=Fulvivirga sp. M361 TaxID=2594266 RepID=UPI00117A1215|nr:hypothetical protein [Fulvivirga sp. M361]TRX47102.1 hypothetical protein FNH22_30555 [Fulvivirga sp. M361]
MYSYPVDFEGTFWTIIDGDYYVSTIGNDVTGDGSPKNPFLTVAKAFDLALDGEKVVIGPDEYLSLEGLTQEQGGSQLPCRLASTTSLNLGVGGMMTIDGIITQEGDRVLVYNQAALQENGIYIAKTGTWTRADDFDDPAKMLGGLLVPVLEGTQNGQSIFQHTSGNITLGSTPITFAKAAVSDWGDLGGDINNQADLTSKITADIATSINALKAAVPAAGDTLEKLYNLIQGTSAGSATIESIEFAPDFDNVIRRKYRTPLQFSNVQLYSGITTLTYSAGLDDGTFNFTDYATVTLLNTYLAGLPANTNVVIDFISNASEVSWVDLQLDRS